jgi:hypothetical protein
VVVLAVYAGIGAPAANAASGDAIAVVGLRPTHDRAYRKTDLKGLSKAQRVRETAVEAVRDLVKRPVLNHAALSAALGRTYLVDFIECEGEVKCVTRGLAKLSGKATMAVYGDYAMTGGTHRFRIRLIDLAASNLVAEVEFTLPADDLGDSAAWKRELSDLLSGLAPTGPANSDASAAPVTDQDQQGEHRQALSNGGDDVGASETAGSAASAGPTVDKSAGAGATEPGPAAPAKKPFETFARWRPFVPGGHRVYLRTYYDSRNVAASEGLIRVVTPLDFTIVGRATVQKFFADDIAEVMPEAGDPDSFGVLGAYSPSFYSFGVVAHIGRPLASQPDAFRAGFTHTAKLGLWGDASLWFLTVILPYDSTKTEFEIETVQTTTLVWGRARAELATAFLWLNPFHKPVKGERIPGYWRPYIGATVWKSIGVFAQYEYDKYLVEGYQKGARAGIEVSTKF